MTLCDSAGAPHVTLPRGAAVAVTLSAADLCDGGAAVVMAAGASEGARRGSADLHPTRLHRLLLQ